MSLHIGETMLFILNILCIVETSCKFCSFWSEAAVSFMCIYLHCTKLWSIVNAYIIDGSIKILIPLSQSAASFWCMNENRNILSKPYHLPYAKFFFPIWWWAFIKYFAYPHKVMNLNKFTSPPPWANSQARKKTFTFQSWMGSFDVTTSWNR